MGSFGVRQGGFQADSNSYVTVAQLGQETARAQNAEQTLGAAIQALSGQVGPPPGTLPPVNTVLPQISGTVSTGNTLICARGTWNNNPTAFSFQWFDDTTAISGATSFSYVVVSGDTSHTITCQVTASNAAGSTTATSNALTASGSAPVLLVAPVASGTVAVGNTLNSNSGTWSGSPTYTYQWYRTGSTTGTTAIGGATSANYTVQQADMSAVSLFCQVTATNANGSTLASSNALPVPGTPPPANPPVNTALPVASGTVATSQVLTVTTGTWSNNPSSFKYRWYADSTALVGNGADTASYTVQSGDTSHTITCQVTAVNSAGTATATSNGLVAAGNAPVNTVAPVASGTVATSQTLSVTNGTWVNGVTAYTYQWCDNGVAITGARSSTYTVQSGDVAATITCKVTASNAYGATTVASNSLVASTSPGGTVVWTGNTTADYNPIIQQDTTRTFNTTFAGRSCIGFFVQNADVPNSTTGARVQMQSKYTMTAGNTYICQWDEYLPRANFPNGWTGFAQFCEIYGQPFGGSPNTQIVSSDGVKWGPRLGSGVYDASVPIVWDQWNTWQIKLTLATSGLFQVSLNGTVLYSSNNYPVISSADATGPWQLDLGCYHQRNIAGGAQFGPGYISNASISIPGGSTGSAPTNSVAPVASGTVANGNKLTVTNGTWSNSPTSYSYQWFANGSPIAQATTNEYAVTSTTASATIFCEVTATNAYGSNSADSNTLTGSGGTVQPNGGPGGNWNLIFNDEFTGTTLDTTKWTTHDGWTNQNGVTDLASNVSVTGGNCAIQLSDSSHGGSITSIGSPLAVGDYAEARIQFPGSGTTMYNWNAWWSSGANWPTNGEIDIMEVNGTSASTNYHYGASSPGSQAGPNVQSGTWAGGFHTYGVYRTNTQIKIYWDGSLVQTYSSSDSGGAHDVAVTAGYFSGTAHTGPTNAILVDYVRVWSPAA